MYSIFRSRCHSNFFVIIKILGETILYSLTKQFSISVLEHLFPCPFVYLFNIIYYLLLIFLHAEHVVVYKPIKFLPSWEFILFGGKTD